jgi:hypothetical protein
MCTNFIYPRCECFGVIGYVFHSGIPIFAQTRNVECFITLHSPAFRIVRYLILSWILIMALIYTILAAKVMNISSCLCYLKILFEVPNRLFVHFSVGVSVFLVIEIFLIQSFLMSQGVVNVFYSVVCISLF